MWYIPNPLYPLFLGKQKSSQSNMYNWVKLSFEVCSFESFAIFTLVYFRNKYLRNIMGYEQAFIYQKNYCAHRSV